MDPTTSAPVAPDGSAGSKRSLAGRLLFPALVVAYLAAFGFSTHDLSFEGRAFPLIIGTVALVLILSIAATEVRTWWAARARTATSRRGRPLRDLWSAGRAALLAIVLTALLIPVSTWVGFFVALPLFLLALLAGLGVRPWWVVVLTALAYWGATYLFFSVLMGLPLPTSG